MSNVINRIVGSVVSGGGGGGGGSTIIPHEDQWVQTRTQGSFTTTTGIGTVITPLNVTITPAKAGNKAVIEFIIFGEPSNSANVGYVVTRNGTLLADTSDGDPGNGYAVTAVPTYDNNNSSTPSVTVVRIIDENTLSIASTYSVLFRKTNITNYTLNFNRCVIAPGNGAETGVSTAKVVEYVV